MPGTAHPSVANLPEDALIDLVAYVRSLAREPQRMLTNHQRSTMAGSQEYLSSFGTSAEPSQQ
jgi:hypothetical protein